MKQVADDLMGIALGPFIVFVGVNNSGREGGKVFLDIVKYYLSHLLGAGMAQDKAPLMERLVKLAGCTGGCSSLVIFGDEGEPNGIVNSWARGLRVVVAGGRGHRGGVVRGGQGRVL